MTASSSVHLIYRSASRVGKVIRRQLHLDLLIEGNDNPTVAKGDCAAAFFTVNDPAARLRKPGELMTFQKYAEGEPPPAGAKVGDIKLIPNGTKVKTLSSSAPAPTARFLRARRPPLAASQAASSLSRQMRYNGHRSIDCVQPTPEFRGRPSSPMSVARDASMGCGRLRPFGINSTKDRVFKKFDQ